MMTFAFDLIILVLITIIHKQISNMINADSVILILFLVFAG